MLRAGPRMSLLFRRAALFLGLLIGGMAGSFAAPAAIEVSVSPVKARRGETVQVVVKPPERASASGDIRAVLLKPFAGAVPLELVSSPGESDDLRASVLLDEGARDGLYAVHVWSGEETRPAAVGKAWFLVGKLILDYPILSAVNTDDPDRDIREYLADFQSLDGNALIVHVLIHPKKAFYPSRIARTDVVPDSPQDLVETFLRHADRLGFACLLSVSWDMTRDADYTEFPAQIRAITTELYDLYGHHPSLAGFYSYQEGSGTYLVPLLREFCAHVKSLHPNLLTACAPYVDDPLLAGYMSVLRDLDVIIYQGMTMASYRPDNVKRYPLRRVRDFCAVGIGGKWLQDKIALTHMELFGYLENRLSPEHNTTSYENIYPQLLSAATAAGSDGVALFTYHYNIHNFRGRFPEIARARRAVADGLRAFTLIWENVSRVPNPLAFYYPYEDWVIERWATAYVPAFDAFRVLGVPADFRPFAPPFRESYYPFYPYHQNEEAITQLLQSGTLLVLPDVSGFHATDSDFLKSFVERGGRIVAFGPQIPVGSTYDRAEFFGLHEAGTRSRRGIVVEDAVGSRAPRSRLYPLGGAAFPGWRPAGGRVLATFEDGTAAVLVNRYGQGLLATISLDAASAARLIPDLVLDVMDFTLAAGRTIDVAAVETPTGCRAAVVNHDPEPLEVVLRPLGPNEGRPGRWIDLASARPLDSAGTGSDLKVVIPARNFLCVEFVMEGQKERQ
ncbi:MAG: DUF4434 domain-containing protein [Candidatus Aminicenantes bacterium]|nr:DUF4434 domain-containing protein [Candidatus Aminicenantes bacterium]